MQRRGSEETMQREGPPPSMYGGLHVQEEIGKEATRSGVKITK
jgi:hypothetical protein